MYTWHLNLNSTIQFLKLDYIFKTIRLASEKECFDFLFILTNYNDKNIYYYYYCY